MSEQVEIIKQLMVDYNGEGAVDWENIEIYIDAGAGGGGLSCGAADALLADWTDKSGKKHRGVIDPEHKQYESAKRKYKNALPIVHLLEPASYKRLMYSAFEKMSRAGGISFPDYDGREFLVLQDKNGEPYEYRLSQEEALSLTQCNLAKKELLCMQADTKLATVTFRMTLQGINATKCTTIERMSAQWVLTPYKASGVPER